MKTLASLGLVLVVSIAPLGCGGSSDSPVAVPPDPQASPPPPEQTGQLQPSPVAPGPRCESPGQPKTLVSGLTAPRFVTVDSEHVYWTVLSSMTGPRLETVWKRAKAGGEPVVVVRDIPSLTSLTAFEGGVYWSVAATGKIFKLAKGSTGPTEVVSAAGYPLQLAANRQGLYWVDSNGGTVNRVGLDGTGQAVVASGQRGPQALALDETHVYWLNNTWEHKMPAFSVMKAPLAGGPAVSLSGDQSAAWGVAVDATHVYVTTASQLLRVGKDGAGLRAFASNESVTGSPTMDGMRVYFGISRTEGGSVMSLSKDGVSPTPVATGLPLPVTIAADATGAYWIAANGILTHQCQ